MKESSKRGVQKKAQQMAAELRNAAQRERSCPKKEKPKSKRAAGDKRSDAKFTQLQTDEDAASNDVEECGEEDEEAMPAVAEPAAPDEESAEKKKPKKKKGKSSKPKRTAAPEEDDNDDAVSALCFGAPKAAASRPAIPADNASAVTCEFGAADDASAILVDDDGDLMEEDEGEEDEITPNDSVSNIGFSKPLQRVPPRRAARSQYASRRGGDAGLDDMPSIVEQHSAEQLEPDLIEGSPRGSPSSETFQNLGDLNGAACQQLRRSKGGDDGFSVVHAQHMAMRNSIPGDEMRVDLAERKPKKAPPRAKSAGLGRTPPRSAKAAPASLDDDDDARSDVTFNFDAAPPTHGRAGRAPPPPMSDDDNSDVGSAVTFNFAFGNAAPPAPAPPKKKKPPPPPKPQAPPPMRATSAAAKRAPPPRPPPEREEEEDDEEEQEEEEERGDVDDDSFTAVGLSTAPRDPYLGVRGGRLTGGGCVGGTHRKWQAPGGKIAHPAHLRYGDEI